MESINRYLKIAKDAVVEPKDRIEEKIMDRISAIKDEEKDGMLDKDFLDFFKKSNSKLYQFEQKVREHPGLFAFISIMIMGVIAALAFIARLIINEESK